MQNIKKSYLAVCEILMKMEQQQQQDIDANNNNQRSDIELAKQLKMRLPPKYRLYCRHSHTRADDTIQNRNNSKPNQSHNHFTVNVHINNVIGNWNK